MAPSPRSTRVASEMVYRPPTRISRTVLRRHLDKWARSLVPLFVVGLFTPIISAGLAASPGTLAWLIDLASHWQWMYLVGLVLGCIVLMFNDRRWALPLLAVPLPWLTASEPAPVVGQVRISAANVLTVASANVNLANRDTEGLIRWLAKDAPGVLVLHEVSADYAKALDELPGYPYRNLAPSGDPFGIAILSRFPLEQAQVVVDEDGIPHIEAQLDWNGRTVGLTSWHPMPPISPHDHSMRNRQLRSLAETANRSGKPAIIAGDLNATPWSNAFSGLDQAGFRRATGLTPTWPAAGSGLMGIPIDHVLVTSHWSVVERKIGPNLGSDHFPVMVRIALLDAK